MKRPEGPNRKLSPKEQQVRNAGEEKVIQQSGGTPVVNFLQKYGEWVALLALAVAMTGQMWSSVRQLSVTSDEVVHLHGGYRFLQCGDSAVDPEHPPLVKIVAALPLLAMHVKDPNPEVCGLPTDMESAYRRGHDLLFANDEAMLTTSRMATSTFAILLLVTTYFFARTLFGTPVAFIAATFVAFEPSLLGHGGLVTTDVPCTLGFVAAIYAMWNLLRRRTILRFLALGFAIGIAFATKYSAVLLLGILPVLVIADGVVDERRARDRRILANLGVLSLAVLVGVVVLWATYAFHSGSGATVPNLNPPAAQGTLGGLVSELGRIHFLPQPYLSGLQDLLGDAGTGRRAFLLGRNYLGGRWYYFPVAMSIKLSLAVIIGLLLSIVAFRFWRSHVRQLLFLGLPVALYLCASAKSGMNLGIRYVFPVIPFLIIFAAAGIWNLGWTRNKVIVLAPGLLCAHAISSLHAFPNYISYGNELWGGSGNVYKYLADSNADWSQALKMAHDYVARNQPRPCLMIPTYRNVDRDYKIDCPDLIAAIERGTAPPSYTGTLVVSSSVVDGIIFRSGGARAMRIFQGVEPRAKLGGSALLVYEGTFDLSPVFSYQYVQRVLTGRVRDTPEVIETAKKAAELDPRNSDAWPLLCEAEVSLGDKQAAKSACDSAYQTIGENPYSTENDRALLTRFMANNGLILPPGANAQGSK